MTTDVSAGALAAGNGALQGAGQKQGTAGKASGDSGFAAELGAADAGRAQEAPDAGPGKAMRIAGTVPVPGAITGPVPGIKISLDAPLAEDMFQLPAGEAVPGSLPTDGEETADGLPAEDAAGTTDEAQPIEVAVAIGTDLPPVPGAGLPGQAASPPLQAGETGLAPDSLSGGSVPGSPGKEIAALPVGGAQAQTGAAGGAGQAPAPDPASGSLSFGDVLASAAPQTQSAGPAERRWQSELPKEFRAQAAVPPQSSATSRQEPGAATVLADALMPRPGNETGSGEQLKPPGPQAGLSTAEQSGMPSGENSQMGEAGKKGEASAQGPQSGGAAEAGPAAKPAVTAQVRAGEAPVLLQSPAAAAGVPQSGEAGLSETLSGDEVVDVKGSADPKSRTIADTIADRAASGPAGADASVRPEARLAGGNPAGSSAAGLAPAASMMAGGDAELIVNGSDLSLTGEAGAATVRGGELSGAMRTDSLQAPTQSQSGHVATQVAAEIARNLKNGQTRFQMRFDPPELGRVEVNMKVSSDGSVHAHLIVDRPETLDMFLRDQRGLEKALEAAGLNPDSDNMQFSLKQDGGREFTSSDGSPDQGAESEHDQAVGEAAEIDPMVEDIVRMTLAEQRGGLDLKI
ncbi:flagellar hook-length control protein FliK [Roseibium marinum]|uniref:flagellar hook-length control protein FliK n=1 Tax=Roseibium marinum TaxID=281252 RepID=UPI000CD21E04|nr:flagellar hook-length control protein FliK [Roseibium marinum]